MILRTDTYLEKQYMHAILFVFSVLLEGPQSELYLQHFFLAPADAASNQRIKCNYYLFLGNFFVFSRRLR